MYKFYGYGIEIKSEINLKWWSQTKNEKINYIRLKLILIKKLCQLFDEDKLDMYGNPQVINDKEETMVNWHKNLVFLIKKIENEYLVLCYIDKKLSYNHISLAMSGIVSAIINHKENHISFHGSCFADYKNSFVICGSSGSGKSTICSYLCCNGCDFISDDLCVIRKNEDNYICNNGINAIRVNSDILDIIKSKKRIRKLYKNSHKYCIEQITSPIKKPLKAILLLVDSQKEFSYKRIENIKTYVKVLKYIFGVEKMNSMEQIKIMKEMINFDKIVFYEVFYPKCEFALDCIKKMLENI